jgi:hypothetical protein
MLTYHLQEGAEAREGLDHLSAEAAGYSGSAVQDCLAILVARLYVHAAAQEEVH